MPDPIWIPPSRERKRVVEVEPHPTKTFTTPDGRRFQDNLITLDAESIDMIWKGYACARCLEGLWQRTITEAFPEKCPTCGFPMKELQRKLLERDFVGHDPTVVSGFPLERELEHLERMDIPKER